MTTELETCQKRCPCAVCMPYWPRETTEVAATALVELAAATKLNEAVNSLPEWFSLSVFVSAGLALEQASIALMVSRRVLEDAEADRAQVKP